MQNPGSRELHVFRKKIGANIKAMIKAREGMLATLLALESLYKVIASLDPAFYQHANKDKDKE